MKAYVKLFCFAALCGAAIPALAQVESGSVSVSAANYTATPMSDILAALKAADQVNPALPGLERLAQPQFYLFAPGEAYPGDVAYEQVLQRLMGPLAQRGYLHAGSEYRSGRTPPRIDIVLRVHTGQRPWRDPVIRTSDLSWNEGLVNSMPFGRMLSGAAETVWDSRAGGSDAVVGHVERAIDAVATHPECHTLPSLNNPANPLSGLHDELTLTKPTRDFFILVIDAFSFKDLQAHRGDATRLWSTFVAVPVAPHEVFSQALPAMINLAARYAGTTTPSRVIFDRTRVDVGDAEEVPAAPGRG